MVADVCSTNDVIPHSKGRRWVFKTFNHSASSCGREPTSFQVLNGIDKNPSAERMRLKLDQNTATDPGARIEKCAARCKIGPMLGFDVVESGDDAGACFCRTVSGDAPLDCRIYNEFLQDIGRYDYLDVQCSPSADVEANAEAAAPDGITTIFGAQQQQQEEDDVDQEGQRQRQPSCAELLSANVDQNKGSCLIRCCNFDSLPL